MRIIVNTKNINLSRFCLFDSLHPCQQSFSYVETGLPGLNQYLARINVSCSRTNAVTPVRIKPVAPLSPVKHSTTEPLCSNERKPPINTHADNSRGARGLRLHLHPYFVSVSIKGAGEVSTG